MTAGRPSRIDRRAVVDAALSIADADGLDAVSMRAVATRLQVAPMALYRHVANKDDLLDALVDAVLREIELPPAQPDWQESLRAFARAFRATAHRHPAVVPLLLGRPATSSEAHRPVERLLQILERAGLPVRDRVTANHVLTTFVLGFAASELSGRFSEGTIPVHERLASLSAADFPAHARASGELARIDWGEEYDRGIDWLVSAIAHDTASRP